MAMTWLILLQGVCQEQCCACLAWLWRGRAFPLLPCGLAAELAASALSRRQRPCQPGWRHHKHAKIFLSCCFFMDCTICSGLLSRAWAQQVMDGGTMYPQHWLPRLGVPP